MEWADDPPLSAGWAPKGPSVCDQAAAGPANAAAGAARWVTCDSVYGNDRRLRVWLEAQPLAYVLAVSGQEYVWLGWQQRQVKTFLATLPEEGWTRPPGDHLGWRPDSLPSRRHRVPGPWGG
jgi:hypothetical protein